MPGNQGGFEVNFARKKATPSHSYSILSYSNTASFYICSLHTSLRSIEIVLAHLYLLLLVSKLECVGPT